VYLGFLENLFEIAAQAYHELCLIYLARPDGWGIDAFDGYAVPESSGPSGAETAIVVPLAEIDEAVPMYPDGVLALLQA
jgi:hypothetical protein